MRSSVERQVDSMQMQKQNGDADAVDLDAEDCTKDMYSETKDKCKKQLVEMFQLLSSPKCGVLTSTCGFVLRRLARCCMA